MRTLSWISRAFAAAAALVAVTLIIGGSYFVGFVSEVQRGLSDPASASQQASLKIAAIEQTLGYNGYLKAYRSFRLTGDVAAREQMTQHAMDAARTLDILRKFYKETPTAIGAMNDISSVVDEFSHVARIAPDMGPAALRGSPAMDALEALPQAPQLEATYLTLRTALERLRSQTQSHQMGGVAWALSWSQMLIVSSLALLIVGLICAAALLQLGITQPLKALERSLTSVGEGQVAHPVWGTDRDDEIGTMARAGEKLRRTLSEAPALKALAEKGEIHIRLDGEASVLLEKLASGVTTATEALKSATTELTDLHTGQRQHFDETLQRFGQFGFKFDEVANSIRESAAKSIAGVMVGTAENMRASMSKIVDTADERGKRLGQVTDQFEQSGKHLSEAVDAIKAKTGNAIDGITTSITAFKRAADGAESIQGAFFAACDKISSDASSTAENIKGLATQLYGVVDHVDGRLNRKLEALDKLEEGIEATLGTIQTKATETTAAIAIAAAAMEQRTLQSEARAEKSVDDFEDVLRHFRGEEVKGLNESERAEIATLIARFNEIASQMAAQPAPQSVHAPAIEGVISTIGQQIEVLRSEVRELAMRMTEERIMLTADMPGSSLPHEMKINASHPQRSLADVPMNEIMQRLHNLTQEMNAKAEGPDDSASLKAALGSFAGSIKSMPSTNATAENLKTIAPELVRHADEIDARANTVEPSAIALRTELNAITSELRQMAANAHHADANTATVLQETALHLGARAESLFSYLSQTHPDQHIEEEYEPEAEAHEEETLAQTTSDLATLAKIIGKLELRASHLSDTAVAANLSQQINAPSPSEREATYHPNDASSDAAITTVFESIERLNNIATALARASDADRLRKAAI